MNIMRFKSNFIAALTTFIILSNIILVLFLEKSILKQPVIKQKEQEPEPFENLCENNPFASSLTSSLLEISQKVDDWMLHRNETLLNIQNVPENETNNSYRIFNAFEPMAECSQECIGGPCFVDGSKFMCGRVSTLNEIENCTVYSFGSNDEWSFEIDIIETTNCEVHVFDCTGLRDRFHVPVVQNPERLKFYHICLGDKYAPAPTIFSQSLVVLPNFPLVQGEFMTLHEIQSMLNHQQVHLLKMDVEGFEWSIYESWLNTNIQLPWQIITEVHYATWLQNKFKVYDETDMMRLVSHLHNLGYATVIRQNNILCAHCCEITLVRYNHCNSNNQVPV